MRVCLMARVKGLERWERNAGTLLISPSSDFNQIIEVALARLVAAYILGSCKPMSDWPTSSPLFARRKLYTECFIGDGTSQVLSKWFYYLAPGTYVMPVIARRCSTSSRTSAAALTLLILQFGVAASISLRRRFLACRYRIRKHTVCSV